MVLVVCCWFLNLCSHNVSSIQMKKGIYKKVEIYSLNRLSCLLLVTYLLPLGSCHILQMKKPPSVLIFKNIVAGISLTVFLHQIFRIYLLFSIKPCWDPNIHISQWSFLFFANSPTQQSTEHVDTQTRPCTCTSTYWRACPNTHGCHHHLHWSYPGFISNFIMPFPPLRYAIQRPDGVFLETHKSTKLMYMDASKRQAFYF